MMIVTPMMRAALAAVRRLPEDHPTRVALTAARSPQAIRALFDTMPRGALVALHGLPGRPGCGGHGRLMALVDEGWRRAHLDAMRTVLRPDHPAIAKIEGMVDYRQIRQANKLMTAFERAAIVSAKRTLSQ